MFKAGTLLTRLTGTLLPVCLVWAFAACVSLCSAHPAEAGETAAAISRDVADYAPESDCCPITEASQGALPERTSQSPQAGTELHTPTPKVTGSGATGAARRAPASASFTSPDPPFERLRTLRI
jgi:hypothetical protein